MDVPPKPTASPTESTPQVDILQPVSRWLSCLVSLGDPSVYVHDHVAGRFRILSEWDVAYSQFCIDFDTEMRASKLQAARSMLHVIQCAIQWISTLHISIRLAAPMRHLCPHVASASST